MVLVLNKVLAEELTFHQLCNKLNIYISLQYLYIEGRDE